MIRGIICLALSLLITAPAVSEPKPPGYIEAEAAFSSLPVDQRLVFQALITGAGYFNGVPNEQFNLRLFKAIKQFQLENGLTQTGAPAPQVIDRLFAVAAPMFDLWGFQKVSHPIRRHSIWVPLGLGLVATRNDFGVSWDDPKKRLRLDFTTVPNLPISRNFKALLAQLTSQGAKIHFNVFKDNWFVISFTMADGTDGYMRYHQDGSFVTGFTLYWNNANGNIGGERIAVLISGSLWSSMTGAAFPEPPGRNMSAAAKPTVPNPAARAPASPPPSESEPPGRPKIASGTGFFVSRDGAFVTAAHVIEDCSIIKVKTDDGGVSNARIVATDASNDVAILKLDKAPRKAGNLRVGVRLGEGIAVFGYPHADILSTSGNFTLGNVTALTGIGDDSRYFQISAPVQSGNSGGPLLDLRGNVVGIVTSKLDALKLALKEGDLPQNVNFAVKSSILATFLDANRVNIEAESSDAKPLDPADLADLAKAISGFVVCQVQ
jgi:serine protease Do